jgi:hypothetical protein
MFLSQNRDNITGACGRVKDARAGHLNNGETLSGDPIRYWAGIQVDPMPDLNHDVML